MEEYFGIDYEPEFKKEKYLQILKDKGLAHAITALHHDLRNLEEECFEGTKGWQPKLYEQIKRYRQFSLELWEKRYQPKIKI